MLTYIPRVNHHATEIFPNIAGKGESEMVMEKDEISKRGKQSFKALEKENFCLRTRDSSTSSASCSTMKGESDQKKRS